MQTKRRILGLTGAAVLALTSSVAAAQSLPSYGARDSMAPLTSGNFTFVPAGNATQGAVSSPLNTAPAYLPPPNADGRYLSPMPLLPGGPGSVQIPDQPPQIYAAPAPSSHSVQGYGQDWGDSEAPAPMAQTYLSPPSTALYQAPMPTNYVVSQPRPATMYPNGYDSMSKVNSRNPASPPMAPGSPMGIVQNPYQPPNTYLGGFPPPAQTSAPTGAYYQNGVLADGQEFKGWAATPQQQGFYTLVARNNAEFVDLWRNHIGQQPPNAALMPGQVAVFATVGPQAYTGHDVTLKLIGLRGNRAQVLATELMPSSVIAQSRADVSPWKILIVRADNAQVDVLQRKSLMGSTLD